MSTKEDQEHKHVTEQVWGPEIREDGVYIVAYDGTVVLKLCRPDRGSDLLMAGYIAGLQVQQLTGRSMSEIAQRVREKLP